MSFRVEKFAFTLPPLRLASSANTEELNLLPSNAHASLLFG